VPSLINAQPNTGVGNFDIEKVRRAIAQPASAPAADSVRLAVNEVKKENFGWVTARIGFYLLLVIVAIFAVSWTFKRLGLAGRSKIGGGSMDTLEVLPLGPNRAVMLVRVMDRVYLLSQTQSRIDVLDKVEGEKAVELIASSKGVVSISQFKDVFNSFMGKMKKNP
jgi:flagellar biosynthetic protein FliO